MSRSQAREEFGVAWYFPRSRGCKRFLGGDEVEFRVREARVS